MMLRDVLIAAGFIMIVSVPLGYLLHSPPPQIAATTPAPIIATIAAGPVAALYFAHETGGIASGLVVLALFIGSVTLFMYFYVKTRKTPYLALGSIAWLVSGLVTAILLEM